MLSKMVTLTAWMLLAQGPIIPSRCSKELYGRDTAGPRHEERPREASTSVYNGDVYFLNEMDDHSFVKIDGTVVKMCDARDWAPDNVQPTFSLGRFNRVTRCYVGCSGVAARTVTMALWKTGPLGEREYVYDVNVNRHSNYNPSFVHQAYTNVSPEDDGATYQCRATDSHGVSIVRNFTVHFYRSVLVDYSNSGLDRVNQTAVAVNCQAQGQPAPENVSIRLLYKTPGTRGMQTFQETVVPDKVLVDGGRVTARYNAPLKPERSGVEPKLRLERVGCVFNQGRIFEKFKGSPAALYLYVDDHI